jgi:hypothetical protein
MKRRAAERASVPFPSNELFRPENAALIRVARLAYHHHFPPTSPFASASSLGRTMTRHHPQLHQVQLKKLRPTQLTVGMLEVRRKQEHWASLSKKERGKAVQSQCFPAALGPGQALYIVDHHHLGLALSQLDVDRIWVQLLRDLSWLKADEFWRAMEHFQWAHPFDDKGVRQPYKAIPTKLSELIDDPYRSLAGELREAGGFSKDLSPYSEFLWAEHLRTRVKRSLLEHDFAQALSRALELSHEHDASYLPGWSGEHDKI